MKYQHILEFWFETLSPKDWYKKDPELDELIHQRYLTVYQQAIQGELFAWRSTIEGRLAEVIVLDQFARNIFRETANAFQYDALALVLSQEAISLGWDQALSNAKKAFLYMPFMHSESVLIHEQAVALFQQPGLETNLEFEYKHKAIIDRFSRYPHRNAILGRVSTPEELAFLQLPGSAF